MVNPRELRLGNLVAFTTSTGIVMNYARVVELANHTSYVTLPSKNDIKVEINAAVPIPLTPEIIELCPQFIQSNTHYSIKHPSIGDGLLGYALLLHDQGCQLGCWDMTDEKVDWFAWRFKYLHQLQNLYFVLTSEELEVKL